ncbi:hypothetical protein VIGAN_01026700 [Vigna angularis var. angularis]|uniref:Uncharacterized protein n=1 Tax=Vigna angularis var. angularis TaxID=157739 RepID=A0A0S3QX07_PHAAN|nr:hypothetical protein VIGAN_01026700 [Vigna angularis var. angularis]
MLGDSHFMLINEYHIAIYELHKVGLPRVCSSSQAWRRRKLFGGHCECLEKQALEYVIIEFLKHKQKTIYTENYNFKK